MKKAVEYLKRGEVRKKSLFREVFSWVLYLLLILVITFLFVHFVGQKTRVNGMSMYPTLSDGDNLIVDKLTYQFSDPKRFDIIVFPFRYQEDTYYVKRVVGLPGETVQIMNGILYINGAAISDDYGNAPMEKSGLASEPVTLGEDEYFVLGDNRNDSSDSREPSVGNISKESIIGKVRLRIWPLSGFGLVN